MKAISFLFVLSIFFAGNTVLMAGSGATKKYLNGHCKQTGDVVTQIEYQGKTIVLGDHALYVNGKLQNEMLGAYAFTSLQQAVGFAGSATEVNPVKIYLEPDVYWTDDPANNNLDNNLIGLKIPQANIWLIGLSPNPEFTVIAGDRGQMAGSVGNWNTLGIGDGFHAYNITFGNYCNVDLVYTPDTSKNHKRRQSTITQAQVITKAHSGEMDKWLFDNCKFISFLNVFSRSNEPHRAYYNNCFFQCTDDAIGTGDINVFEKCRFRLFSNHPSGSASNIIQVYLGCYFEAVLHDSVANSTIFFAKKNNLFAMVDGVFEGNLTKLEWTDTPNDEARHYVYNNTLRGRPVSVSERRPELSVPLKEQLLKGYKVGAEYNIYNLLRGDDDWDPKQQKVRLMHYAHLPYQLKLKADKPAIEAGTEIIVGYDIQPKRVRNDVQLKWCVSDIKTLSIKRNNGGSITLVGHNNSDTIKRAFVKAVTPTGVQGLASIAILPRLVPAPKFTRRFHIESPESGTVRVNYALDLGTKADQSAIDWYRAASPGLNDTIKVAVSRLNQPLKTYPLTTGDIGYYLVARIQPKHTSSTFGKPVVVASRKIKAVDVISRSINTDFKNMPTERSTATTPGFWIADTYRPLDLSADFEWSPDKGDAWSYGRGHGGTADRFGLMTVGRGARLLYSQAGLYNDMQVVVGVSPHKASGQGFGSATGQYADIYIKFNANTLTGYGLRIQRTPAAGDGVQFTLLRFANGAGTAISDPVLSSAFMPGCTVELKTVGNKFTARVTTASPQQQGQKDNGLVHEVNLQAIIETNTFGGFGVQHTGTVSSAGNRLMLERIRVDYP